MFRYSSNKLHSETSFLPFEAKPNTTDLSCRYHGPNSLLLLWKFRLRLELKRGGGESASSPQLEGQSTTTLESLSPAELADCTSLPHPTMLQTHLVLKFPLGVVSAFQKQESIGSKFLL